MKMQSHIDQAGARARRLVVSLACALAAAAVLGIAAPQRAHAKEAKASCTILEIAATNAEEGIDPALSALAKKLKKPPFSSWKSFRLVKRHDKKLERMKPDETRLELGGKLTALYHQSSVAAGKKPRYALTVTLDDKQGKRKLDTKISVDAGDYFLIAMSSSADRSEVLALTCHP